MPISPITQFPKPKFTKIDAEQISVDDIIVWGLGRPWGIQIAQFKKKDNYKNTSKLGRKPLNQNSDKFSGFIQASNSYSVIYLLTCHLKLKKKGMENGNIP